MDNSKKLLIIGANGLIGSAITKEINPNFNCIGTSYSRKAPNTLNLDITKFQDVKKIFKNLEPTYVIHCANLAGGVDFCEKNPDLAKKFHLEATINIGNQCISYNSKFIFISSECVFDGRKDSYNENDALNPVNVYGECKAKSEEWIQKNLKDYIIVRTMSIYGWDPLTKTPNTIMKVFFSILKGEKIFAPTFRWGNPTYVKDLAKAILELCLSKENGIFHVAGTTFINRYEWLKKTCDILGWDSSLLLPQNQISKDIVSRPCRINLDKSKFSNNFTTMLHSLEDGLRLLRKDIINYDK